LEPKTKGASKAAVAAQNELTKLTISLNGARQKWMAGWAAATGRAGAAGMGGGMGVGCASAAEDGGPHLALGYAGPDEAEQQGLPRGKRKR
jgi:cyanophycinase-like exopeptidase